MSPLRRAPCWGLLLSLSFSGALKSFCSALTADLRSISNDRHLFVFYSPNEARQNYYPRMRSRK